MSTELKIGLLVGGPASSVEESDELESSILKYRQLNVVCNYGRTRRAQDDAVDSSCDVEGRQNQLRSDESV